MLLESYRATAPAGTVETIQELARQLRGKSLLHISSSRYRGDVAEMLQGMLPLLQELEVPVRWETMASGGSFLALSKVLHKALQGHDQTPPPEMLEQYLETCREAAKNISFDADAVVIHDPQPLGLIHHRRQNAVWLWRCHSGMTRPPRKIGEFLKPFVQGYDGVLYSYPESSLRWDVPQYLLPPAIDPMNDKNRNLSAKEIEGALSKLKVPQDKPILLQLARFERVYDPLGAIKVYRLLRRWHDCRLVLACAGPCDDEDAKELVKELKAEAHRDSGIQVLELPLDSPLEINALQRAATVVLRRSMVEGFSLAVAEAMWKGKCVVASATAGLSSQILSGVTGYTADSVEGMAFRVKTLLENQGLRERMGRSAKEFVRSSGLITRHIQDLLSIMLATCYRIN